jgi:CheY-like chemotaxis protein
MLEKSGHTVVLAGNGKAAVASLKKDTFDLVLMDVQMPELDGLEVTKAIRKEESRGGTRIPIIALTAHAMKGDKNQCLKVGMDDYVSKPIKAGELFEAMARQSSGFGSNRGKGGLHNHFRWGLHLRSGSITPEI